MWNLLHQKQYILIVLLQNAEYLTELQHSRNKLKSMEINLILVFKYDMVGNPYLNINAIL
jgi:hypothetical protein